MNVKEILVALREEMRKNNIDVYVVPTADFHQSEYVGEYFKARKFVTGFSGSAGTAVIALDEARLWVDGRYFIQAEKQIEGTGVEMMKMLEPGYPTINEYLEEKIKEGMTIGFDGRTVSMGDGIAYRCIAEKNGGSVSYDKDLIDTIWKDRPELSKEPAFMLEEKYTGESIESKLSRIREEMKKAGAESHILTTLDDICWTLNIRGNDIEFFPLVLSYAVINMNDMHLYIDESKLNNEIKAEFEKNNIKIHPYNDIYEDVKSMTVNSVMVDPTKINYAIYSNIPESIKKIEERNPEILFKSCKNEVEVENMKKAQIKDSVAHVRFMKWIKENYDKEVITEMSASDKLDEFRKEMGGFIRPSFEPISSYGAHAAMCHYTSSPETDVQLKGGTVYLSDTGAGFYEGSTDITRTFALGEIPEIMKEHFTLVLMCNLGLGSAVFMKGCTGINLDILARKPLWDRRIDFNHGTGHGMGYLLNIHESPANFRWRYRKWDSDVLQKGMIITDEPGIYVEGSHGVRLENELLVCEDEKNAYGEFMRLEHITFVPMDLDAVKVDMLSDEYKKLLNDYHKEVYEKVSPYLDNEEKEWLKKYTRAI
ncbi:aminopeptidase P family protein [Peptacetobacter hominis]|uniref:Aminopeptidase P family protein n=1 Tax=Peptacetobacter hominis TaxID=2743610 RepID=A0A544QUN1_9FIRM|nr:aminopeptidase P family protein [Peptacetobacter hominis]TQQ84394.1 aminopeptidase P family protein [Peptacetobacter hominis]